MDIKGTVKEYVARNQRGQVTHIFNVLLLNDGVIPFSVNFPDGTGGGVTAHLQQFFTTNRAFVRHAFYRPCKEAFDDLDSGSKLHVTKGGLLFAPLGKAMNEHVHEADDFLRADDFQGWLSYLKALYNLDIQQPTPTETDSGTRVAEDGA